MEGHHFRYFGVYRTFDYLLIPEENVLFNITDRKLEDEKDSKRYEELLGIVLKKEPLGSYSYYGKKNLPKHLINEIIMWERAERISKDEKVKSIVKIDNLL